MSEEKSSTNNFVIIASMKLLLTSSGISNSSIADALAGLVGRPFSELNIVFIPTAASLEKDDKSWLVKDLHNAKELGFKNFYITDLAIAPREVWLPQLEAADVIMVGGGHTEFLYESMEKSGFIKELPLLLKSRVYVGISAGSIVCAEQMAMTGAGLLYYEEYNGMSERPGLGFIPFEIRPHYKSDYFPKVNDEYLSKMAKEMACPFYAIDDNSAVQVIDGKVEVISEGEWKKFN